MSSVLDKIFNFECYSSVDRLVSILTCPTGEMLNKWMDVSISPGVSISPIISTSVWFLGSSIDFFTGASSLKNKLDERDHGVYKFVITTPTRRE